MASDFVLLDSEGVSSVALPRSRLGEMHGRNEAWLRDTLLAHPALIPLGDIDPAFGPLVPLCRELNTGYGRVDAAFISPMGRLTLVECKLWRNPQARREVVAQVLDYAQTLSRWTYADLQRQVATATGLSGNVPFDLARQKDSRLDEATFVDHATQALQDCRFLLIVAGNGIHGSVGAMTELLNRNAGRAFTFALVDVGLYEMPDQRLLVHASVPVKTQNVERHVVLLQQGAGHEQKVQAAKFVEQLDQVDDEGDATAANSPQAERYRSWWQPLVDRPLRDPEQAPPRLFYPNHLRAILPGGDTWILAYASGAETDNMPREVGVGLRGRKGAHLRLIGELAPEMPAILAEVPDLILDDSGPEVWLGAIRHGSDFTDANACREWIFRTMDAMVAALRPRMQQLIAE